MPLPPWMTSAPASFTIPTMGADFKSPLAPQTPEDKKQTNDTYAASVTSMANLLSTDLATGQVRGGATGAIPNTTLDAPAASGAGNYPAVATPAMPSLPTASTTAGTSPRQSSTPAASSADDNSINATMPGQPMPSPQLPPFDFKKMQRSR